MTVLIIYLVATVLSIYEISLRLYHNIINPGLKCYVATLQIKLCGAFTQDFFLKWPHFY